MYRVLIEVHDKNKPQLPMKTPNKIYERAYAVYNHLVLALSKNDAKICIMSE